MTNKDHIERTNRMIEVMQAYVDGEKVEFKNALGEWQEKGINHGWYCDTDYRIAKTPDTINWDHVAPEFKWMARDLHGRALLYQNKPRMLETVWVGHPNTFADYFLSYRKGTVDWKDSLVIRPGCE